MASDSQTATATTSEKPLENKVNEEANLMEKEIVLPGTADQTPASEPEKEPPVDVVEEVAAVVKAEESTDKGKDENGEEKVVEQVELKEPPTLVKEGVAEVNDQANDAEEAEGKGKDENGEEKVAEQVELKEPILVKESVEQVIVEKKVEEKQAVESVAEGDKKGKEEEKMVDVSEETIEDKIKDVEVLEVEPKPEASEEVEAHPEKVNELAPEVEVVKTVETPETTEQAKVELEVKMEDSIVETKDSSLNSKDQLTSESAPALCPEQIVPISQDSDTAPKKDTEGEASSLPDATAKPINKEKHVVEEPSKDEKEKVSDEAKDVVTETPAADGKRVETLKETDTESTEGNRQEESITEKVAEVAETTSVVKESNEPKQQPEVKHSRSIMSKVKQSLVKAKKAVIGKSPSSKTIITEEAKEEINAK